LRFKKQTSQHKTRVTLFTKKTVQQKHNHNFTCLSIV